MLPAAPVIKIVLFSIFSFNKSTFGSTEFLSSKFFIFGSNKSDIFECPSIRSKKLGTIFILTLNSSKYEVIFFFSTLEKSDIANKISLKLYFLINSLTSALYEIFILLI